METLCFLPIRKSVIHWMISWFIPYDFSLCISRLCGTVSKHFWKSIYMQSTDLPLSRYLVHWSRTFSNCSEVDLPFKNPNCLFVKSLLFRKYFIVCSLIIFSILFAITLVRLTGW